MFRGVYTAIVTPFTDEGNVDEEALRSLVDFQIENGVSGLVPTGTTGESPTLTHDEHVHVIEVVIDQANGKVPVIAGTGSNSTAEAIYMTKKAADAGADATLQVCPYYNKPTQHSLIQHFTTVANEGGLPVIVYNIQGRTGVNIETATLLSLADHNNIVGVKEASGNFNQMLDVVRSTPKGFSVLSGDDNLAVPLTIMGGQGVISVLSNFLPKEVSQMVKAALAGNISEAQRAHYQYMDLMKAMFIETNPVPVKAAMAMMGLIGEKYRLPLTPMTSEHHDQLQRILSAYQII
ncbi:MAG: 4-hydroxy-tetrahydrodipicolinate synthase [Candidatus Methanofastidiosa archaeon]|nr:4-hydroxy-tetrahydrodipicolinate synthase [Candidatus Methanofastidiosa archaeon]